MSNFPNQGTVYLEGNPVKMVSLLTGNSTPQSAPKVINGSEREQIMLCDPLTGLPLDLEAGGGGGSGTVKSVNDISPDGSGNVELASTDLSDASSLLGQSTDAQSGTAYTLALGDAGQNVDMSNATANVVTVPTNATAAIPVGTLITVTQAGAGATSVAAASGVTFQVPASRGLTISTQYETATLFKVGTNTWRVYCN